MNKNSGALLRDIRNMKRNYTMTQKQMITSAKQLKKARSSQQLSLNQFLETKNQKIKNIDERLQIHQTQIEKNNNIISQLNHNFLMMKDQMLKEKQKWQNEERRNKLLRQQIQRTNKLLRNRNLKMDQVSKKAQLLEKENQTLKSIASKLQEKQKMITSQKKLLSSLEDSLNEKKCQLMDRQKEIRELREKSAGLEILKQQQQSSKERIIGKQREISEMGIKIRHLQMERNKFECRSVDLQAKIKKLQKLLQDEMYRGNQLEKKAKEYELLYHENHKKLTNIQNEQHLISNRLKSKQNMQQQLKNQTKQHRLKAQNLSFELDNVKSQLHKKQDEISKLTKKIKELENHNHSSQKELEERKYSENKLDNLRKKAKNLQEMYKTMVPQIQCPYGHELHNPVTIIPCGHNYCLGCKKGYAKECMQCSGKLKIEAVYRNQLMDDIIGIINSIRQIIDTLK